MEALEPGFISSFRRCRMGKWKPWNQVSSASSEDVGTEFGESVQGPYGASSNEEKARRGQRGQTVYSTLNALVIIRPAKQDRKQEQKQ